MHLAATRLITVTAPEVMHEDEPIRKQVGEARDDETTAQRMFRLRQMQLDLLSEAERARALRSNYGHIRKTVGRSGRGQS